MAFLRIEKKSSGTYLRIIESYRDETGHTCKRTLHHLGKVEDYTPQMLRTIGQRLFELGGGNLKDLLGEDVRELSRQNYGYHQVYYKLLQQYGLEQLFRRIGRQHRLGFSLTNAVMLMLVERLHAPASKRAHYFNQQEYTGLEAVSLHWLYRSLNHLSQHSETVKQQIYHSGRDLFNATLDLVFYDVTTFYFDSEQETEGALRQKGFGKDGKIGKTQVLFGLLLDKDKRPVSYDLYCGSTYEGHTLADAIRRLKDTYHIGKIILVADRGLLSKENRQLISEENGYEFILGERLKNLPASVQEVLLDPQQYNSLWAYDKDGESLSIRYTTLEVDGRTIIGTYSEKRAAKDKAERDNRLKKAEQLLQKPQKLQRKAGHYFLKSNQPNTWSIDWEKVKAQERFDGYLAICTNTTQLPIVEILDQYRHLFQIEHAFRSFKSYLETRPMFHWTDERIKGHICMCYIAYTLLNHLQILLRGVGQPRSENHIRKSLDRMQLSLVQQGDAQFYLRANLDNYQKDLLQLLTLKKLPSILPKDSLAGYL